MLYALDMESDIVRALQHTNACVFGGSLGAGCMDLSQAIPFIRSQNVAHLSISIPHEEKSHGAILHGSFAFPAIAFSFSGLEVTLAPLEARTGDAALLYFEATARQSRIAEPLDIDS
jgi:hypothetical protein